MVVGWRSTTAQSAERELPHVTEELLTRLCLGGCGLLEKADLQSASERVHHTVNRCGVTHCFMRVITNGRRQ